MKVIAIVSAKGGVGKTTVTATLSTALRYRGHTVVTCDLDPQNALRLHLGLGPHGIEGISRATLAGQPWREVCHQTPSGVVIMPYGGVNEDDRRGFENHLDANPGWLKDQLNSLPLGDDALVLLDTPPGPSVYMRQALTAANVVVVVTLPDAASYATLPIMHALVRSYCQPRSDFAGVAYVINQVDNSRQLAKDVVHVMHAEFGERVIGMVHQDPAVSESLAYDQSVLDYDKQCQATRDFLDCVDRLVDMVRDTERLS